MNQIIYHILCIFVFLVFFIPDGRATLVCNKRNDSKKHKRFHGVSRPAMSAASSGACIGVSTTLEGFVVFNDVPAAVCTRYLRTIF